VTWARSLAHNWIWIAPCHDSINVLTFPPKYPLVPYTGLRYSAFIIPMLSIFLFSTRLLRNQCNLAFMFEASELSHKSNNTLAHCMFVIFSKRVDGHQCVCLEMRILPRKYLPGAGGRPALVWGFILDFQEADALDSKISRTPARLLPYTQWIVPKVGI
jgi:hypothetical protein